MAIQVWDDQAQQYRGVELARYGANGTLAEALVWVDGQYRKVWPTGSGFTDNFTSPTLHSRWMLLEGDYTPPGLHALVLGPAVSASFEATQLRAGAGDTGISVIDDTFMQGIGFVWEASGGLFLYDFSGEVYAPSSAPAPAGSVVGLRRADGQWHLTVDGDIVASAPDPLAGVDLSIVVQGVPGAPVTRVSYTEL